MLPAMLSGGTTVIEKGRFIKQHVIGCGDHGLFHVYIGLVMPTFMSRILSTAAACHNC